MTIQWYGHACFKLTGNTQDVSILIDPFDASSGLKPPKNTSDITLVTTQNSLHNSLTNLKGDKEQPFVIQYPGEYEVKGAFVYGIFLGSTVMYSIGLDELFVVHTGSLNRQLTADEIDQLGRVDILLISIGGKGFTPGTAVELINQLEPRIVIPMQYAIPGINGEYGTLDAFLKEFGVKECEKIDKFKIAKKDLPAQDTQITCLIPV